MGRRSQAELYLDAATCIVETPMSTGTMERPQVAPLKNFAADLETVFGFDNSIGVTSVAPAAPLRASG
jgi:hypothetical protein